MQAKKSIEKMNTLMKMRKAKKAADDQVLVDMPVRVEVMSDDEKLIERAKDIYFIDEAYYEDVAVETIRDASFYLAVLREEFPNLDNGSITGKGFTRLNMAITGIQLAEMKAAMPAVSAREVVEELMVEKHYEEHISDAEVQTAQDTPVALHAPEKNSHGFFDAVIESVISRRVFFGFGR